MLADYETLSQAQKNTFKSCANELLSNTFLCRDKQDNKEDYYFVLSFKGLFDEFFSILGYEIEVDKQLGTVMLIGETASNVLKLKRDETVILLILRILYAEHMKETSVNNNVIINVEDIQNKYKFLEIKKNLNKTDLVKALRLFRKYNLIEVIGLKDALVANTKVVLLPTLLSAVKTLDINELHTQIRHILSEVEA